MTKLTPAEAALKTQEQLAKVGKVEISNTRSLVNVRFNGRLPSGEPVQLHAMEPTLAEAMVILAKQAAGRLK